MPLFIGSYTKMFVNVCRIHSIKVMEVSLLTSNIQENRPKTHTYKSNSISLQTSLKISRKWSFLQLFFSLQWLLCPWKNVLADLFLSRLRMVSISYYVKYNIMLHKIRSSINLLIMMVKSSDFLRKSSNSSGMLWKWWCARLLSWALLSCWSFGKKRKKNHRLFKIRYNYQGMLSGSWT